MAKNTIEYSGSSNRFAGVDLEQKVRESRAFWASPEGKRKQAQLDREARSRVHVPPRFPDLARSPGTRPKISPADEVLTSRFL